MHCGSEPTKAGEDRVALQARIRGLEAALADERAALADERARTTAMAGERDRLREAYRAIKLELELLKRRLFMAKRERIDTTQLELEFGEKLAALDALVKRMGGEDPQQPPAPSPEGKKAKARHKSTGRRDLMATDLPKERIEILDPELEGKAERIGFEESAKLAWRRPTQIVITIARAKYRLVDEEGPTIETAELPPELINRSLATPSLLAHIATDKLCDGLPLHRQEDRFARAGVPLDRGTMCRWLEDLGMTVGATVVAAMRAEALATAFCISTDATGVLVQPIRGGDTPPRGCRRGHYFVQIADADHVFFEYVPRENSAAVATLFKGFSGYVQADAKSVYDILFRPPDSQLLLEGGEPDPAERHEVGCWSHFRRKFWEAAIATKDPVAREGLLRIKRIFDLDRTWRGRPPAEIKALREVHLRPHTDALFPWIADEYDGVKDQRGLLRSALGYGHRQHGPLVRFFDDGRLQLTNNGSERQLRRIATGRKAWLFVGSDDHAEAAGNLLSLIASARLHRIDPEIYMRDVFRVLPHWPRGRYLELAPRYWLQTRACLDPAQLDAELGPLTIPHPPTTAE